MIKVDFNHFVRAALEIGHSGDNDTLPYDLDSGFVKEKAHDLAALCLDLFQNIETGKVGKAVHFMNGLAIAAERLLVPSGPHGFPLRRRFILSGISISMAWAWRSQRRMKANGAIGRTPIGLRPKAQVFSIAADRGALTSLQL